MSADVDFVHAAGCPRDTGGGTGRSRLLFVEPHGRA